MADIFNMTSLEFFSIMVIFISFFGLMVSNNAIKAIVYMGTLNAGIITFWVAFGGRQGTMPPIFEELTHYQYIYTMSDPVPQALMITAIVIGFSVTAINIIMMNTLFRKYDTSDWGKLFKLAKEDYSIKDGRCPDDFAACADKEEEDLNA